MAENSNGDSTRFNAIITGRIRHAVLLEAARKAGSQPALAKRLGISLQVLNRWINLKDVPTERSPSWMAAEKEIFKITGMTYEELFPAQIREKEFLDAEKTFEVSREYCSLRSEAEHLSDPSVLAADLELKTLALRELRISLSKLTESQRLVISARYGIGSDEKTQSDIAKQLKISATRVSQIEQSSLDKIKQNKRLEAFVNGL